MRMWLTAFKDNAHCFFQTIYRYCDLFELLWYFVQTKEAKKVLEKGSQSKVSLHTHSRAEHDQLSTIHNPHTLD